MNIQHILPEEYGSDWHKVKEDTQGTGRGGRTGRLLALAKRERPGVGKTRIPGAAAGGGWEMSLLWLHHLEVFRD